MTDKHHLTSLKRGLAALRILNAEGSVTAAELARRLAIPRTNAQRVLDTLQLEGYVVREPARPVFHLAGQVRSLALGFNRDALIAEIARPVLRALCAEALTPVGLATPLGPDMVIRVSMDFDSPLALTRAPEGAVSVVTQDPMGHLYLAYCGLEARERMIALAARAASAPDAQPRRIPAPADLQTIRHNGYAYSAVHDPQSREAVLAAPVFVDGEYIASLYMRFMKRVFSQAVVLQRYLPRLRAAAQEIEAGLARRIAEAPAKFGGIERPLLVADAPPD